MWPDGTIERFDEIGVVGVHPNQVLQEDPDTLRIYPLKRSRAATLEDLFYFMEETLRTYQSYWYPQGYGDDWRGYLPFAFLLEKGMTLLNKTTNAVYTIKEVVKNRAGRSTGEVLLAGVTPPVETDNLELESKDRIQFTRASPRAPVGVHVEETATRKDTPSPFKAYADFAVLSESPAEANPGSARPATIGRKKAFREEVEADEPTKVLQIRGRWADARIRIDLWGSTDTQAESLVYWFYNFVDMNSWVWKFNGIQEIYWVRRSMDQPVGLWRANLYHRPLEYFVRTEHLFTAEYRKLEHATIYAKRRKEGVLEQHETPRTGRPTFNGAEIPVTVQPNEI